MSYLILTCTTMMLGKVSKYRRHERQSSWGLRINKDIVTVIAYRYNSSQNKHMVFLTVASGGPYLSCNIANHALPRAGDSGKHNFFSNDSLILKMTQASTRCFTNNDHLLNLNNLMFDAK